MAKGKNKKDSKPSAARCTCDHPYTCSCGHRPPRPSKGHKWDPETQTWGGKGHKQKGASGQTASVSQQAQTTAVGKTQVAQWQRLPSLLLEEVCHRQKRPQPKYKSLEHGIGKGLFKYRVIVPDGKDPKKDLFFVPAQAVPNEEQAKEEGALLALLQLTPSLPHERKLPEPYKTTWLNAIQAAKTAETTENTKATNNNNSSNDTSRAKSSKPSTTGAAQASTNLTMGKSYTSISEKRKQQEERRREKNVRIRRHEAIRMANQNHQVFMSTYVRKQIESLLRGEHVNWDDDEEGAVVDDPDNDTQMYVEERLHSEGFTRHQARTAFKETVKAKNPVVQKILAVSDDNENEDGWDTVYEECLQWLLVHLNEDQLPEGFDPRGRTLDVIAPGRETRGNDLTACTDLSTKTQNTSNEVIALATRFGLSAKEARLVQEKASKDGTTFEEALWATLRIAAGLSVEDTSNLSEPNAANNEILKEEIEALEAIFPTESKVSSTNDGLTVIAIELGDGELLLEVMVRKGLYPSVKPERVWLTGEWKQRTIGSGLHAELLKFMNDLTDGEPMVFELYGQCQNLLESDTIPQQVLIPILDQKNRQSSATHQEIDRKKLSVGKLEKETNERGVHSSNVRRPRERRPFWSIPASRTAPAVSFPDIPSSITSVRRSLPAASARDEFLALLRKAKSSGRVMLVEGDTGCGKTTQIPQFIIEEFPKDAKVVIAQPRRLAATGVATRVAEERGESKPGVDSVGYVVRGDSALSPRSRLVFCTTGVLLRQLQSEGALDCISHIVIDEVHERHLDSDILMGLLKQSLPRYPQLHVILMSATLDADRFADYWGGNIPRMHIPGRTFPVTDYTLEDVLLLTGYVPRKNKKGRSGSRHGFSDHKRSTPWDDSEKSDDEEGDEDPEPDPAKEKEASRDHGLSIDELVSRVDQTSVDYDLVAHLVKRLVLDKDPSDDGSILVFLSGAPEINNAMEAIKRSTRDLPINVLPLHGGLQPQNQNLVFRRAERGFTKVVLSTNIAEASVTIPDCVVVIDTAREKQASYDPANRMPLLVEQFASRASLKQRRGRAGRVRKGTCYKLISKSTLQQLSEYSDPEIKRCALEQTLLSLLFLGVETGAGTFMSTLLDPPTQESLRAAATSLMQLGAVKASTRENELLLTPLGVHLAGIPAPPIVGKMLVMGSILGCRDAALAMAAGLSIGKSPFLRVDFPGKSTKADDDRSSIEEMKQERVCDERRALSQLVGASDHALLAAIYMRWSETGAGGGQRKKLCDSLGLSFSTMRDMTQLVQQLDSSLKALGFAPSPESNRNGKSWRIIRAVAICAMAPSQLVKVVRPATKYHETAEGAKEKDGLARELKFFIRTKQDEMQTSSQEERVFIHPSSANFSIGSYSCPWLVYFSMVRTSKPFLRDVTECNAYPLLLFGGQLDVQASKGLVVVDDWVKLAANARIGSLMGDLRRKVDLLLSRKVEDPAFEIAETEEMQLIVKLITTDGLGTK